MRQQKCSRMYSRLTIEKALEKLRKDREESGEKGFESLRKTAKAMGVASHETIRQWLKKDMSEEAIKERLAKRGRHKKLDDEMQLKLKDFIDEKTASGQVPLQSEIIDFVKHLSNGSVVLSNVDVSRYCKRLGVAKNVLRSFPSSSQIEMPYPSPDHSSSSSPSPSSSGNTSSSNSPVLTASRKRKTLAPRPSTLEPRLDHFGLNTVSSSSSSSALPLSSPSISASSSHSRSGSESATSSHRSDYFALTSPAASPPSFHSLEDDARLLHHHQQQHQYQHQPQPLRPETLPPHIRHSSSNVDSHGSQPFLYDQLVRQQHDQLHIQRQHIQHLQQLHSLHQPIVSHELPIPHHQNHNNVQQSHPPQPTPFPEEIQYQHIELLQKQLELQRQQLEQQLNHRRQQHAYEQHQHFHHQQQQQQQQQDFQEHQRKQNVTKQAVVKTEYNASAFYVPQQGFGPHPGTGEHGRGALPIVISDDSEHIHDFHQRHHGHVHPHSSFQDNTLFGHLTHHAAPHPVFPPPFGPSARVPSPPPSTLSVAVAAETLRLSRPASPQRRSPERGGNGHYPPSPPPTPSSSSSSFVMMGENRSASVPHFYPATGTPGSFSPPRVVSGCVPSAAAPLTTSPKRASEPTLPGRSSNLPTFQEFLTSLSDTRNILCLL